MRGKLTLALAVLVLGASVQVREAPARQAPGQRRAVMEAELMDRFVQRSSRQLQLNDHARIRLRRLLDSGEQERRTLVREGVDLERRLQRALAEPASEDAEFEQILDGLVQLRQRELMLWRREQLMLAEFMSPRQRAEFVLLRSRFNRAVQDVRARPGVP